MHIGVAKLAKAAIPQFDIKKRSVITHLERLTPTCLIGLSCGSAHLMYFLALQSHDHGLSLADDTAAEKTSVNLTARELECLEWTAEGLPTGQIAVRMATSTATLNCRFSKVVPKFGAMNRHHAAIMAVRVGLIWWPQIAFHPNGRYLQNATWFTKVDRGTKQGQHVREGNLLGNVRKKDASCPPSPMFYGLR